MLLEQVLQAHQIFLLHHAQNLTELFSRLQRSKFCAILRRFWDNFVWNWDVLLHGNPAIDIFNGLKLAAGGELGIGVGEEEWGSGEREVLEGFVGRTDGLVDLIVSRFGEATLVTSSARDSTARDKGNSSAPPDDWHLGQDPRPSDGVIFSGVGAIGRPSVKRISNWVVSLFKYGQDAYGIRENPVAVNRRQRKKTGLTTSNLGSNQSETGGTQQPAQVAASKREREQPDEFGIPAPIVGASAGDFPRRVDIPRSSNGGIVKNETQPAVPDAEPGFGAETLMKYVTFGLYSSKSAASTTDRPKAPSNIDDSKHRARQRNKSAKVDDHGLNNINAPNTSPGCFMVGLQGDLDEENDSEDSAPELDSATDREEVLKKESTKNRIMIRTLVVQRVEHEPEGAPDNPTPVSKPAPRISFDRLRVVVYVKRPFIFTFLFELQTDSLAIPSFYRSLHHQLGPLQQPLLNSTSPSKVSERLLEASAPKSTVTTRSSQPICDLLYDPYNLTVHTTIPNIPEPGATTPSMMQQESTTRTPPPWTRVEALSVHSQILNTYISTRPRPAEYERTCKTNRGWWVVWMRLPHVAASQRANRMVYREAFLIRKASDYVASSAKVSGGGGSWGRSAGASSGGGAWGPAKLAEGIGIDARQYIEGLVSLNR